MAFVLWRRFGGSVLSRRSRFGWWPHFLWARIDQGLPMVTGWLALWTWLRGYRHGIGYLVMSRRGLGFLLSVHGIDLVHMVPCPRAPKAKLVPPPIFRGCVRTDDDAH